MNKILNGCPLILSVTVLIILSAVNFVFAQDQELTRLEHAQGVADLHPCRDENIGVELLCNRHWKQEVEEDAVMIIIQEDPAVLLTVAKSPGAITGIEELTQEKLQLIGQYEKGFKVEKILIADVQAVRVDAYPKDFPEMKLMDFYVVHDFQLYSFMFSVNPKEEWANYAILLETVAKSIRVTGKEKK